jgi:hypothetical protein
MNPLIKLLIHPRARAPLANAGVRDLIGDAIELPWISFPEGDPRLQRLFDYMNAAGVPLYEYGVGRGTYSSDIESSTTGYYYYERLHSYEPGELEAAAHVMLWVMDEPQCFGDAQPQRVDGKLVIDEHQYRFGYKVRRKKFKMWECERSLLVDAQIRDEMIAANFRGLAFRETLLGRRPSSGLPPAKLVPVAPGQEMFELVPTIELPPMVPEMVVKHGHTHVNPGFDDFQPVYRQTNLASAFDIARASEPVNAYGDPESRFLIMSQRFYQYCMKYCKHGGFLPVLEVD